MSPWLRCCLASLALPLLGACNPASQPGRDDPARRAASTATPAQPETALGRMVDNGNARGTRRTGEGQHRHRWPCDRSMGGDHHAVERNPNLPKAEITPKGDLLIEGKAGRGRRRAARDAARIPPADHRRRRSRHGNRRTGRGPRRQGGGAKRWKACSPASRARTSKSASKPKAAKIEASAGKAVRRNCRADAGTRSSKWPQRCPSSGPTRP